MLVMLLPEQVSNNWEEIKGILEETMPGPVGSDSGRMNYILQELLIGKKKVWLSYNEENIFDGMLGTEIYLDRINGLMTLEIFGLWSKGDNRRSWILGMKTIWKYAKGEECVRIVVYSSDPSIIRLLKKAGADVSFTFCDVVL